MNFTYEARGSARRTISFLFPDAGEPRALGDRAASLPPRPAAGTCDRGRDRRGAEPRLTQPPAARAVRIHPCHPEWARAYLPHRSRDRRPAPPDCGATHSILLRPRVLWRREAGGASESSAITAQLGMTPSLVSTRICQCCGARQEAEILEGRCVSFSVCASYGKTTQATKICCVCCDDGIRSTRFSMG